MAYKALVVGAGIAGYAAAWWLERKGHSVVLVDRAPKFEAKGHFFTIKGIAVEILEMMGCADPLRAQKLPSNRLTYYTSKGRELRKIDFKEAEDILGGYIMCRRAEMHQVLHDALPPTVNVRWGVEAAEILNGPDGALVTFSNGVKESFDFVLGCDGAHSKLRSMHFPEVHPKYFRGHYIVFVTKLRHNLNGETKMIVGGGRNVNVMPVSEDRVGVVVYQDDRMPTPPDTRDALVWRDYLTKAYADYPQIVRDAMAAISTETEFFADKILQVPPVRLAKGRLALLGDSGFCPTFFSGMGAASALIGAYTIAHQLDKYRTPSAALLSYESIVAPIVAGYQKGAWSARGLMITRGAFAETWRNVLWRNIPNGVLRKKTQEHYQSDITLDSLQREQAISQSS